MASVAAIAALILSTQFDLNQWGLQSIDEIGYVNIGILQEEKGNRALVYDVRKSPPQRSRVARSQSRDPARESSTFVLSRFEEGNRNALNGYFNAFMLAPATAELSIGEGSDAIKSLIFEYQRPKDTYAGFWIHLFDSQKARPERIYFDSSAYNYASFAIRGDQGGEKFTVRVLDDALEGKEDSLPVGELDEFLPGDEVTTSWQTATVPLSKFPARINRKNLAGLVFQATDTSSRGKIFLKDLMFAKAVIPPQAGFQVTAPKLDSSLRRQNKGRAMWLWESEKLQSSSASIQKLIQFCKNKKLTDIFVQIPYEAKEENGAWQIEWDEKKMRPLIAALSKAGVRVHALDGDPRYALEKYHGRQLALLGRLISYNSNGNVNERFSGFRYDNEPYLTPAFWGVAKEEILTQYISLLRKTKELTEKSDLDFGVDVPFWFDSLNDYGEWVAPYRGGPVMSAILEIVDNIGIMDYRTLAYGADGVIAHAEEKLIEAQKRNKRVFVGLETVPLPDETIFEFANNKKLTPALGMRLLDNGKVEISWPSEATEAKALRLLSKTAIPSSKITFHGLPREQLERVMQQTEQELRRYKSFAGLALHSYESLEK